MLVGVVVDGRDGFGRHVGVVSATSLGQKLGHLGQLGILVELKELVLNGLHLLRARSLARILSHAVVQHVALQIVIAMIAARNHAQVRKLLSSERNRVDVLWRAIILGGIEHSLDDLVGNLFAGCGVKHAVPVEVVDARKAEYEVVEGLVDESGLVEHRADGHVAKANAAVPSAVADHGLGYHSAGIGEVDEPRVGAQLLHLLNDVENDGDSAQRLEHAARAVGLLSQHAMAKGDALILNARLEQTYAELRGNEIGIAQRLAAIERKVHFYIVTGLIPHALGKSANDLELLLTALHVHEPNLAYGQAVIALDKAVHKLRCIAAATTDGANLKPILHGDPLRLDGWSSLGTILNGAT